MDKGIKIGLASFLATATVLLAVPVQADANPGHGDGTAMRAAVEARIGARFAAMDADGDGTVTRAEADGYREARHAERRGRFFARLDADGNGEISAEERAAMRGRHHRRGARPNMAGDTETPAMDAAEAPAEGESYRSRRADRHAEAWAAADENGNGALTASEFDAMAAARHERADRRDRFAGADADGDGSLTLAEMQSRALDRFDGLDADGDGTLTREERRAGHRARRDARRSGE